jgi:hypothetical protein
MQKFWTQGSTMKLSAIALAFICLLVVSVWIYRCFIPIFHIEGTVVNEDGHPVNGTVYVNEAHRISITDDRYTCSSVGITSGHFKVTTKPCDGVTLDISSPGYEIAYESFASPSDVPSPFRVILKLKGHSISPK